MKETIKTAEHTCTIADVRCSVIRYAWGNEQLKTWFITKTPKAFLPKGSRLLFKMGCESTNEPISATESYPKQGDVINDVDSYKLKVISIEWN